MRKLTGWVAVWSRNPEHAAAYAREMVAELEVDVTVAPNIEAALRNTDLLITTTPSREPLVRAGWLPHGGSRGVSAPTMWLKGWVT